MLEDVLVGNFQFIERIQRRLKILSPAISGIMMHLDVWSGIHLNQNTLLVLVWDFYPFFKYYIYTKNVCIEGLNNG